MAEFEKNTLNVISVSIESFSDFLMNFVGRPITIWLSSSPAFYAIDSLSSIKFTLNPDMLVLFGSNDNVKVSIPSHAGFGIKLKRNKNHYWIDKFNEKEALVIKYNANLLKEEVS